VAGLHSTKDAALGWGGSKWIVFASGTDEHCFGDEGPIGTFMDLGGGGPKSHVSTQVAEICPAVSAQRMYFIALINQSAK
jgi:hypothetical protein